MPPKKTKQDKASEVLASTLDRGYMVQALLARDARSETLAHLILQRDGYCPREQERGETEIVTEIKTLHDALSRDYGVSLPLPTEEEVAAIHQGIIEDFESGSMWLSPAEEEILALFDSAFPALTAHMRQALSTQPLSDSLAADALDQLVDRIVSPVFDRPFQAMEDKVRDHLRWLVRAAIAERHRQNYHTLSAEEKAALIAQALAQQVKERIVNISGYAVLRRTRNWVAPGEQQIARHSDGTPFLAPSAECPPSPGESPTLTITIDLSKVHLVGVTELAEKFKASVTEALHKLPPEWHPFPKDLDFLRTISWEDFERDLKRFDLHMKHGLEFRQIAYLEEAERQGQHLLPSSLQHIRIGTSIPGEDGAEKSVKRVYTAIHRKPYRARRKRIDTPAQGLGEYCCSTHPLGDCPESCPNVLAFLQAFNTTAPTATTGRGKGIVSLDEL
jgi:hypothetical protein